MSGGNWKDMYKGVTNGDVEVVRFHLRNGVDPNYQHPEFGTTALLESVRKGHLEVARVLLEHDAKVDLQEHWGDDTPIALAEKLRRKAFVALFASATNQTS